MDAKIPAAVLVALLIGSLVVITSGVEKEVPTEEGTTTDSSVDDHDHADHDHGAPIVVALLEDDGLGNITLVGSAAHAYPDLLELRISLLVDNVSEVQIVLGPDNISTTGAWEVMLDATTPNGTAWNAVRVQAWDTGTQTGSQVVEVERNVGDEETEPTIPLSEQCLDGHASLALHHHAELQLTLNGDAFSIPSDLGLDTSVCEQKMHLVHTHDSSGWLHIEGYESFVATMDIVMEVWAISFPTSTVLHPLTSDIANVTVTVDGTEVEPVWSNVQFLNGATVVIVHDNTRPDTDGDGVADEDDLCEGHDDALDADIDGEPDGCDVDDDNDGVSDEEDLCPGEDDRVDVDVDGIPDACDDEVMTSYDPNDLAHFWLDHFLCQNGTGTAVNDLNTTAADGHVCAVTVTYDETNITVTMNGLPNHDLESGPGCCAAAQDYTMVFPRAPSNDTTGGYDSTNCPSAGGAYLCAPDRGEIAFAMNGVPIYGPEDGPGGDAVANHHGQYDEDRQEVWLGACHGHSGPGGTYHYHADANCMHWHGEEGEGILDYILPEADEHASASPVIGVGYDGYPIYGLLEEGVDGVVREVTSSYRLKDGETGYNGIDSYEFVEGLGDLDVCNGHFGPTADFPEGIYHYHSTMENGEGGMGFPYFLICYKGTVVDAALTGGSGGGDDPCAGHGVTWGPGIGPPPAGCDQGPPPGGQSTDVTQVHPVTVDASLLVVLLVIAAWMRRRSG